MIKIEAAARLKATETCEARAHDILTQLVSILKNASVDILHQTTKDVLGSYYDVRDVEHILKSLKAKQLRKNHYMIVVPDMKYDLYAEIDPDAGTVHLQYK